MHTAASCVTTTASPALPPHQQPCTPAPRAAAAPCTCAFSLSLFRSLPVCAVAHQASLLPSPPLVKKWLLLKARRLRAQRLLRRTLVTAQHRWSQDKANFFSAVRSQRSGHGCSRSTTKQPPPDSTRLDTALSKFRRDRIRQREAEVSTSCEGSELYKTLSTLALMDPDKIVRFVWSL